MIKGIIKTNFGIKALLKLIFVFLTEMTFVGLISWLKSQH